MRTLRVLFFAFATLFAGTCLAQGETKFARDNKLHNTIADPSPWDKAEGTNLWHLKGDTQDGRWEIVLGVVGDMVYFTITLSCGDETLEVYEWKYDNEVAIGTNCAGLSWATKDITPFKKWITPLPMEVREVIEANYRRRLAKARNRK